MEGISGRQFSLCKGPVVQKLGVFKDLSSHVAGAGRMGWGCVRGEAQSQCVSKAIHGQEFGSKGAGEVKLKFAAVATAAKSLQYSAQPHRRQPTRLPHP